MRFAQARGVEITYFVQDHLHSTSASLAPDGTLSESGTYLPFGADRTPASVTATSYGFTDQERDRSTGFYNYDARQYDPMASRFLSPDSLLPNPYDPQQLNRYAYARNNPLKYVDPSGHVAIDGAFFVGGAVLGLAMRAAADKAFGTQSSWQDYVGAAVSGGVTAVVTFHAGPVVGGAAGAFAGNLTAQLLNATASMQSSINIGSLATDTLVGAATGRLLKGSKIKGVNIGRNSFNAISKQMKTKLMNGTISYSSVKPETAVKMFIGTAWDTAMIQATGVGIAASDLYGEFTDDDMDSVAPNANGPTSYNPDDQGLGSAADDPERSYDK